MHWNPSLYLKFHKERIQPVIDLVSRINLSQPNNIIDIGCGPGNSTALLAERWPDAKITGIDNSPSMIKNAKKDYPNLNWRTCDAGEDKITGNYDLVFSNAAIQWIPNHSKLIRKFFDALNNGGILTVQLPLFYDMLLGISIEKIGQNKRWNKSVSKVKNLFTIHNASYYYDILSPLFQNIEIWKTDYIHTMESHHSILEMIKSTGLKPYLEHLENEQDKLYFKELVLKSIQKDYPQQKDGKVLFPFKRLFFIARKG